MTKPGPAGPRQAVKFALFALSGNQCAFPACDALMYSDETILGEICHIHAIAKGGPRYHADLTLDQLHSIDNLILLCQAHHKIVDDHPDIYRADRLHGWKAEHESQAQDTPIDRLRRLLDRLAPQVPENWWERPNAPVFRLHLAGNKPPDGPWRFDFGLEQVDGGDVGSIRYRYRHGETEYELKDAQLERRHKWRLESLNIGPRNDPLSLEVRCWWDGAERVVTWEWEKEDKFQRIDNVPRYS